MPRLMKDRRLSEFLESLGAKAPTPGGGSAAAVAGALGAGLVEMAARYDSARRAKKGERVATSDMNARLAAGARRSFLRLAEEDIRAFSRVAALKEKLEGLPYKNALRQASQVPLEVAHLAASTLTAASKEAAYVGRWIAGDLLEAGILLAAVVESCEVHVRSNAAHLGDARAAKRLLRDMAASRETAGRAMKALRRSLR